MASAPDDALYHQTKIPIGFWYRRGLNPKSLIQLLETLPVKLTGTINPYNIIVRNTISLLLKRMII